MRQDLLDPLPYTAQIPSLMSATGRVDAHTIVAHYLMDNKLNGAYLEFGVGQGRSAVAAIRAYSRANVVNQFYLFDSFCGLPKLTGIDCSSAQFKEGDYSYSYADVKNFLIHHDVWNKDQISMHAGWFENSLPEWLHQTCNQNILISVLHLDMDLYESCITVLNAVKQLLQTGTILMFDDWNCFNASNNAGERRATLEWLENNPDIKLDPWFPYGWHGQTFFCQLQR